MDLEPFFVKDSYLCPSYNGRNRTICAGAHWEEIPSGCGTGHTQQWCMQRKWKLQTILIHDASHRKCSWKNSNCSSVKNIHLKMGFMGIPRTTPCYYMSWKPLVLSLEGFNHKKYCLLQKIWKLKVKRIDKSEDNNQTLQENWLILVDALLQLWSKGVRLKGKKMISQLSS